MDGEYRTVELLRFVSTVWRKRSVIAGCAVMGLILGVVASIVMKPKYDATARLQPPSPRETGLLTLLPARNQGDLYLGFLTSRTVADDVIEHQHLKEYFHTSRASEVRRQLSGISTIKTDKDQFLTVTVRAAEAETAARIANEYVDALYRLSHSIALSEAEHRWEYFEVPLEQEKNKLAAAEEELARAQQQTGLVLPEAQVRLGVSAEGQLKQEIASREVQLAALRNSSTEENPRVIQLKSEIASLHSQVERMHEETSGGNGISSGKGKLPELTLEVERKVREVKYHETLFGVLSRQYENAKVDQSYTPPIEVIDRAIVPDEKSWPPRKYIVLTGVFCGGFIGLVWVSLYAANLFGILAKIAERIHNADLTDA